MRSTTIMLGLAGLLGLSAGCASERAQNEPPTYQDLKQDELASERQEYIDAHKQHLSEISREIGLIEARLTHESKFVDEDQRADWKQDLFELKQERDRVKSELSRAQTASAAEWEQMRGPLGEATDSLQAGVKKLRAEVSEALAVNDEAGEESRTAIDADSGLCPVGVPGARAAVQQQGERVSVSVTTEDSPSVAKLREKGNDLAKTTQAYQPARSDQVASAVSDESARADADDSTPGTAHETASKEKQSAIPVTVTASNIDAGVKLVFTPKNGQANSLRAQLERDAAELANGRCEGAATVSMRDEDH